MLCQNQWAYHGLIYYVSFVETPNDLENDLSNSPKTLRKYYYWKWLSFGIYLEYEAFLTSSIK